ncbi:MAG TPA: hypothetical protein VFL14_08200 [Xanthomonadales bacterium]|nr:hypothetical protein [Xanthomonadales bacterium]
MKRFERSRLVPVLATLLLAPAAAHADRITAAYPELATAVATDSESGSTPAPRTPARRSRFSTDVDYQKMAIITEDALGRGYKIVWVNPPQKSRDKPAKDDR